MTVARKRDIAAVGPLLGTGPVAVCKIKPKERVESLLIKEPAIKARDVCLVCVCVHSVSL